MLKKYKYHLIILVSVLAIWGTESQKARPIDWFESYSRYDKIPYGNYVLYNELGSLFHNKIIVGKESIEETLYDNEEASNYLFINDRFYPTGRDLESLLDYVAEGNTACIISRYISDDLLDSLQLDINYRYTPDIKDSIKTNIRDNGREFVHLQTKSFSFRYFDVLGADIAVDTLGCIDDSLPDFIACDYGEGQFFMHLNPLLFTNFHMLKDDNYTYVSNVLSHLPDKEIIWDEYYKNRLSRVQETPFHIILESDGLRYALYIILLSLPIYMLFAAKRKQRIIPLIKPYTNESMEFAERVSMVYLNAGSNKSIGTKRVQYFLHMIRSRYHIDTEVLDDKFCSLLSRVSGVELTVVKQLVTNFNIINGVENPTDERLLEQDSLIERFNKQQK